MSVPVTILCGGLGAGKTTLLSRLLETDDREIAVVVNDVGEVNVDADLVEARTDLESGAEVTALENGCICCSLGTELSRSVIELWKRYEFDALVVEASGVGEPEPIAHQFVRGPAGGPYELDQLVTVVDARAFHDAFAEGDEVPERRGPDESGTRPLADLLLEQAEFCDLLVVNKCDLVSDDECERVVALLETLQPRAEILTTAYGAVDPDELLEAGRFDLTAAREAAGWKAAIEADADGDRHAHAHDHTHPPERYGIEVDTYQRTRPLHPERFAALLADLPAGLVRAKGLCWLAGRERAAITMSYAGTETSLEVTGRWIASFSEQQQETYRESQPDLVWDERWGDRECRLALIGRNVSMDALCDRLDDCLLTDAELEADWSLYENPAPTSMGELVTVGESDRRDG
ncbi:CobW family GTP-binding protein [Natrononativus amylolyticus]|uniref:CobW family GTP-binding protein n=1 Tax=Natrononativus amylolyticus TaxID=2963434 RepID=UPI0020CF191E|nr:GTP-binding protein [Natrononativus amylolyticus]